MLNLPNTDAHDGWLIFKLPPAELGIHPKSWQGPEAAGSDGVPSGFHELYLMCDDIETTVAELNAKGVEFTRPVESAGFGLLTSLRVPGAGEIGLYQPRHDVAYDL